MSLGITFKPSEQQGGMGTKQAAKEGGAQSAIQMLSLRYPKVSGAKSITGDPSLLAGNGAPRVSGFNPNAAILQAMIHAFSSGGVMPSAGGSSAMPSWAPNAASAVRQPSITPVTGGAAPTLPFSQVTRVEDPIRSVNPSGFAPRSSYMEQLSRKYSGGLFGGSSY
jgi:hypothetical protein